MGIFGLSLYFSLIMCQVLEANGELSASVVYSLLSTKLNAIELNTHTLQLSVSKLEKRIGDLEKLFTSDKSDISTDRQTNKHDTVETLHVTKTSLLQAFKQEKSYIRSFLAEQDKQQQQLRSLVGDQLELINVTYDRQFTELRATVDEQFNYLNISQDKKITELRATVDEQFNYLNVSQDEKITELRATVDEQFNYLNVSQDKKITELRATVDEQFNYLNVFMDTTNKTTSTLSTQMNESIDTMNKHMKERFTQLGTDISKRIGFTAWLKRSMKNYDDWKNVVFDIVRTNIGDGYNGRTGIFTAPVSGLYMFQVNVGAYDAYHMACAIIVVDGSWQAYALVHKGRYSTGSNSAVVYMTAGQNASVRTAVRYTKEMNELYGINGGRETSFTGVLIN